MTSPSNLKDADRNCQECGEPMKGQTWHGADRYIFECIKETHTVHITIFKNKMDGFRE